MSFEFEKLYLPDSENDTILAQEFLEKKEKEDLSNLLLSMEKAYQKNNLTLNDCKHIISYFKKLKTQHKTKNHIIYDIPFLDEGFYSRDGKRGSTDVIYYLESVISDLSEDMIDDAFTYCKWILELRIVRFDWDW